MSGDKTQRDLMNNERFKDIYVHASQEPWLPFYPGIGFKLLRASVSGAFVPSRSALEGSGCFGGPGPGQQLGEAAVGPVVDELGQHVGEVGLRVDGIQLAGLDQRGEHGPVFRAFVAASE